MQDGSVWWGRFKRVDDDFVLEQFQQPTIDIASQTALLKTGMLLAETEAVLGKSVGDIGSGLIIYAWVSTDGSIWLVWFNKQYPTASVDNLSLSNFERVSGKGLYESSTEETTASEKTTEEQTSFGELIPVETGN